MPQEPDQPRKRVNKKWLLVGGTIIGLLFIGMMTFVVWSTLAESRRKEKAEVAVRSALTLWCSEQTLPDLDAMSATNSDWFSEFGSRIPSNPRPIAYQVTGVNRGEKDSYLVAVNLTFAGGAESRLYEVQVHQQSGKCFITTKASLDVSSTESQARSVLQVWLDCWIAGEDMLTFKRKHPEVAGDKTMDYTWADLMSQGKRLVSYDVTTTSTSSGNKFRFNVTAVFEVRGTPETKILRYSVSKDRPLGGGRWCITNIQ